MLQVHDGGGLALGLIVGADKMTEEDRVRRRVPRSRRAGWGRSLGKGGGASEGLVGLSRMLYATVVGDVMEVDSAVPAYVLPRRAKMALEVYHSLLSSRQPKLTLLVDVRAPAPKTNAVRT